MQVVVPLRRISDRIATGIAVQPGSLVFLVFQYEVHGTADRKKPDSVDYLVKQMRDAVILDRMNSVQPQPVEMKFLDPIKGVLDDKFTTSDPSAS